MNRQHRLTTRIPITLALAAVSLCLLMNHGDAQAPGAPSVLTVGPSYTSGEGKSSPKFPNVDLVFTLTAADGTPIPVKPGDLKLFAQNKEIGTANTIRTFEQTGYGITAILALDASGSMKGAPLAAIHASVAKFVNQARPQDRVEVLTFADQTQIDVPFGASPSALANELNTVQARGKHTVLFDGLMDALTQFTSQPGNNQPKRRQLVVISDGHDEVSKHNAADVILKAKSLGVVIDSIGLTKDNGAYLVSLQQLSQETGGNYRRAQSAQELEGLIGQGIQAMRATPVAAFKTSHLAADDTVHSTQLRWQPGSLAGTAFIKTPKASPLRNPWIWTLGGCFLAGVILLIVSLIGSRKKSGAMPAFQADLPRTDVVSVQPSTLPMSSLASTGRVQNVRTPTVPDNDPTPTKTQDYEQVQSPAQTPIRARTQLAVFFDAPAQGPFARLEIKSGDLAGKVIPVTAAIFSIGAVAGNQLILPGDLTISGQHARLLWEDSVLKIENVSMTNGTFVNSERLAPGRHLLKPGDEIRVGQALLVVHRA